MTPERLSADWARTWADVGLAYERGAEGMNCNATIPPPPADTLAELDALLAEARSTLDATSKTCNEAEFHGLMAVLEGLTEAIAIVKTLRGDGE